MSGRLALILIACASRLFSGQSSAPIQVDVDLVAVACSTTDRTGAPARNLRREDFVLWDNGAPQTIKYFWQETDLPLTIGLIVDVSGSQAGLIGKHRQTVAEFLAQMITPRDRAFLVTVARDVKLVTDLTNSLGELRAGVERIEGRQKHGEQLGDPCRGRKQPRRSGRRGRWMRGCGGTALWNGVYSAARLKMRPLTGRKALIVLSDGLDTGSTHSLMDAIEAAQGAETMVYTIRYISTLPLLLFPPMILQAVLSHGLERLSQETGGRAFGAPKGSPADVFAQIETELRNVYVLGFTLPQEARDGRFHKLEVKLPRPDLVVRARTGYYARLQPQRQ